MRGRGLIIAAPRSGEGKTTLTLGLMQALARSGVPVRAFKNGPDYIDPAFHAAATGKPSLNLDSWAMPQALLHDLLATAQDGELCIAEGSMGLFDGGAKTGAAGIGATADLAASTGWPVVLVIDVSGQAQSAAAIAHGCATLRAEVRVAGVVLNRVASPRHEMLVRLAMQEIGQPVFGSLGRRQDIELPERHLGLVQAGETKTLKAQLEVLADLVAESCDLEQIRAAAEPWRLPTVSASPPAIAPPGQRIALAEDVAFSFIYPHLTAAWRRAGAEIHRFSPLANEAPNEECDCCWLPGGYPELHGGRLASADNFKRGIRRFAETRPVHGECGGFMVLGEQLEDADGVSHAMCGLLGHSTSFAKRKLNLGYRAARLNADSPIGRKGDLVRGHEFHYARVTQAGDDAPLAELSDAAGTALGPAGARRGQVSGSFFHMIAGERADR